MEINNSLLIAFTIQMFESTVGWYKIHCSMVNATMNQRLIFILVTKSTMIYLFYHYYFFFLSFFSVSLQVKAFYFLNSTIQPLKLPSCWLNSKVLSISFDKKKFFGELVGHTAQRLAQ